MLCFVSVNGIGVKFHGVGIRSFSQFSGAVFETQLPLDFTVGVLLTNCFRLAACSKHSRPFRALSFKTFVRTALNPGTLSRADECVPTQRVNIRSPSIVPQSVALLGFPY